MLEQFEEVVEDWYFHHQDQRLENFLCQNHVLETSEQGRGQEKPKQQKLPTRPSVLLLSECLKEVWKGDVGSKGGAESGAPEGETPRAHDGAEL